MIRPSNSHPLPADLEGMAGGVNPFQRGEWDGRIVALDGCSTADFFPDEVDLILAEYDSGDEWDGNVAGVIKLKDGRWVAWETFYGPTGSGFSADAYGGDADMFMATSLDILLRFGLTDEGRRKLGIPEPPPLSTVHRAAFGSKVEPRLKDHPLIVVCEACATPWPCDASFIEARDALLKLKEDLDDRTS